MNDEVVINTAVLENDAENVWEAAARVMSGGREKFPTIPMSAFGAVPGMEKAAGLYAKSRNDLRTYFQAGNQEFLTFEKLLLETVILYKKSHGASVEEIRRLEEEIEV